MNIRRVWILIKTEVVHGPKDVILVIALIMPLLLALFFNLAFGNIFTDRAKLGICDEGQLRLTTLLASDDGITLKTYENEGELKKATASGSVDMGIVLPSDFDNSLQTGIIKLKAYVWGESLAKNRTIIPITLADTVREMTGATLPVDIETIALGKASTLPWNDRLLPLIVLVAVFYGGIMLPASSLIHEKQRHTLEALNVTPVSISDIFAAKGIIGVVLAVVMGVLTLSISGSFGNSPLALVIVLALGAIMAVELGLIAGAYIRDMNSLFALWKFGGILLIGPAIVFMFPQIPAWVGYIFPTYYVVKPVMDLSVSGLGFGTIVPNLLILAGIVIIIGLGVVAIVRRLSTQALRLAG